MEATTRAPIRTCAGCREALPQEELVRLAVVPEAPWLVPDAKGKLVPVELIPAAALLEDETVRKIAGFGRQKGGRGRLIGRTKGGMSTKLHAICDSLGRPISFFVTAGQVSDYIGAAALLSSLPQVDWLLGDRGYDADWFRDALKDKGICACIPGRKQRKKPVKYDKRRYKRRNRIEIMFGRLKDWRRVATRYDRCPKVFLSAIMLASIVIYWL